MRAPVGWRTCTGSRALVHACWFTRAGCALRWLLGCSLALCRAEVLCWPLPSKDWAKSERALAKGSNTPLREPVPQAAVRAGSARALACLLAVLVSLQAASLIIFLKWQSFSAPYKLIKLLVTHSHNRIDASFLRCLAAGTSCCAGRATCKASESSTTLCCCYRREPAHLRPRARVR